MDTPIEPGSPASSASSDSIIDDDIPMLSQPERDSRPERSSLAAKRRLAGGAGGRDRDTKARRREDSGKGAEGPKEGRPREEYLDVALADYIRKLIKDPFDEDIIIINA
ncbi:unnamed protein product [Peniophora sp. CBMAI 1063]|nr:unnamed protein product [Peniophora sp. CBMAI 1063]